ncbi:hypothetical protein SAMN05216414_1346 [Nitrosovibrio sp. Nv17]|jgi:hypothetical protein|nr:hypothetical protein SAMN05216414_1346 [Nitrosovibrio sp. Nv17]
MPEIMSRAELVADLADSLHDVAEIFAGEDGADFGRHLDVAALDMARVRPRTLLGSVTLVAEQCIYAAPPDIAAFKSSLWGMARAPRPWEKEWTGPLPDAQLVIAGDVRELHLSPAPTSHQIGSLGAIYRFYYFAAYRVAEDAAHTTVTKEDRGLLLLRAQAEAMRELAMRNTTKPVAMRDGISGGARNGTPTYLFQALMAEFESRIR